MKVFTASLGTETNTFAAIPTGRATFEDSMLYPAGSHPDRPTLFTAPLWAARQRQRMEGWEVVEGLCTFATPSGVTVRAVYESLRDEILGQLAAALPVDMVLLGLHGAMVADGYDDCEGDMLARIRAIVGPTVVVGAELDPHCHLTERMTGNADVLVCFKEYPHIDSLERGEELVEIAAAAVAGTVKPRMSVYDCGMIGTFHTTKEPMRGFVERIKALEGRDGVLSISIAHGFPYGDVADMGTRVLVVTDDRPAAGAALAETLGRELYALRGQTDAAYVSIDEALDAAAEPGEGPLVLADTTDNAGGGASSDSTFLIRAILERGLEGAAVGPLWDPIAVQVCHEAGEGARLELRFGGKMGRFSGDPIDLEVTVTRLVREATQTFGNATTPMGDCAAISGRGLAVVLNSRRTQAFGPDLFTNLGIDPRSRRVLVVKSNQHFHAGFAPLARQVLYVDGPGLLTRDLRQLPYRNIARPKWPFDETAG